MGINESCFFNEQCEQKVIQTECRDNRCSCRFEMTAVLKHDKYECIGESPKRPTVCLKSKYSLFTSL